jgi:hypothetical protein
MKETMRRVLGVLPQIVKRHRSVSEQQHYRGAEGISAVVERIRASDEVRCVRRLEVLLRLNQGGPHLLGLLLVVAPIGTFRRPVNSHQRLEGESFVRELEEATPGLTFGIGSDPLHRGVEPTLRLSLRLRAADEPDFTPGDGHVMARTQNPLRTPLDVGDISARLRKRFVGRAGGI